MIFTSEQYIELLTFGRVERQMFCELFGLLTGVEEQWLAQGATRDEISLEAFDWDFVPVVDCGGDLGIRGGWKETVVEETEEYLIKRDSLGRRLKLYKNVSSIPLPLDYPVRDMESWLAVKPMFKFDESRVDRDGIEKAAAAQANGALVVALIPGGFDLPRQLMGAERACLCYYDQPELMHDILDTVTTTAVAVLERITDHLKVDQLSVHEDLAGKSGPMPGPRQFETFIKPYYTAVWELLSSRGARLFNMDTDGNVEPLIDLFIESGLNVLHPMEPAAGMDMVKIRKEKGRRLAVKGGIDKFVIQEGRDAIVRELEYKMQPLMQEGGTVFGLDHRIPNDTPLDLYRFYVDKGREILGLPPRSPTARGWRRMAF